MVRVIWNLNDWLRGDTSYLSVGLYVLFVALAALAGYIVLHRKIAAIAAGSTAMALLGFYNLIASVASSLWIGVGFIAMGLLIGAGVFYGGYSFLAITKRQKQATVAVFVIGFAIGMSLSLIANLVVRMSFAS